MKRPRDTRQSGETSSYSLVASQETRQSASVGEARSIDSVRVDAKLVFEIIQDIRNDLDVVDGGRRRSCGIAEPLVGDAFGVDGDDVGVEFRGGEEGVVLYGGFGVELAVEDKEEGAGGVIG